MPAGTMGGAGRAIAPARDGSRPAAAIGPVGRLICDRGYSADRWGAAIRACGAEPVVPPYPTHRRAPAWDRAAYRLRHRVENLWARLKGWRDVATRYDKTEAAPMDWLADRP